ncbi:MAG: hypothetical protein C4B57_09140 [Deltaproteobacteria bacterium]|nr:MAG: hypothetical protein C4B57_09140 [Deltaproteobacteria bacterium]
MRCKRLYNPCDTEERRVFPSARRFTELGASSKKEISPILPAEKLSKMPLMPELVHDQGPSENEQS